MYVNETDIWIYKWIFRNIGVAQNKTYLQMTEKYIDTSYLW